jgi:hypothetical protein
LSRQNWLYLGSAPNTAEHAKIFFASMSSRAMSSLVEQAGAASEAVSGDERPRVSTVTAWQAQPQMELRLI